MPGTLDQPHPYELPGRAFLLGSAVQSDLSSKQLRHPRFEAPYRGVRRLRRDSAHPKTLRERVAQSASDYLPLLRLSRGEAFSHTTALHLHGAPIRTPPDLHVSIPRPHGPARGALVHGHHHGTEVEPWQVRVEGTEGIEGVAFACVPPVTALIQSAPLLSFREQVVAADHLVKLRSRGAYQWSLVGLEQLLEAAEASNARGIRRLRAALRVARVGAESRMESLQHFELARMGIDDLELQAEVYDAEGRWIGRFDAVDRVRRLILEYDGEQHRLDRKQYLRDQRRLDRARDAGYEVKRTHLEDFQPRALEQTREEMCAFLQRRPRRVAPGLAGYFAEPY